MPLDLEINIGPSKYVDLPHGKVFIEHGDINLSQGHFKMLPKYDKGMQVAQRLHIRLLLRKGEVFFNTQAGFPYLQLAKFKEKTPIFDSYMKDYILGTVDVVALAGYRSELSNMKRSVDVKFEAVTQDNNPVTVIKEIDV